MRTYQLRQPVQAVQAVRYEHSVNEQAVFELINANGGASFMTARGHLEAYNIVGSASAVDVHNGQWVVALQGGFVVLDEDAFEAHFVEAT